MLICLLAIFAVVVCSHPLTPFFVIISVTGLVVLRGYHPRWLPLALAAMTLAWIFFMTRAYLAGHLAPALGEVGQVDATFGAGIFGRIVGSPGHIFITLMRVAMTALIWLLAVSGFFARLKSRQQDATVVILWLGPFLMAIAQSYGGEILLRIFLFGLPAVAFLVAGLIFPSSKAVWSSRQTAVTIGLSLVLLGGFVFTRYGNERNDYMSVAEVAGMRQLYRLASPGDLLVDVSEGAPWKFQQLEQFDYMTLLDTIPKDLAPPNVIAIAAHIRHDTKHTAYLIITRSQAATLESTTDLTPEALDRLESALVGSHEFKLIYHNQDVRIYVFTGGPP
jgi:hypothetical protein